MQHRHARGFTQIELIVTIVLIGIVSAIALPRFASQTGIEGQTFADEASAALRYAQKTAIASRRLVCASFTASTLQLAIASANGASACNTPLAGPNGQTPYTIDAGDSNFHGATGFVAGQFPAALNFDPLGRPRNTSGTLLTAATVIAVTGGGQITVEPETGHVH